MGTKSAVLVDVLALLRGLSSSASKTSFMAHAVSGRGIGVAVEGVVGEVVVVVGMVVEVVVVVLMWFRHRP